MPTSTRSTRRSSSATIRASAAGRSSSAAGVVLAASYEAKAFGVRTAMGGRQARRLCPQAVVVPPRMSAYTEASKAVFEVFERHDAAGRGPVDRRGVPRRRRAAADRRARPSRSRSGCAREVLERVGLRITVGVARTKFLAKVASGVAKPDGLLVVPPDGELDFLHPLPVERLWGVGPVTAEKLHARGHHHRRRGRPPARGRAGVDARPGVGPPPPRPRPQPRSRGRSSSAGAARSIGSQRALGRAAAVTPEVDRHRWSSRSSTA